MSGACGGVYEGPRGPPFVAPSTPFAPLAACVPFIRATPGVDVDAVIAGAESIWSAVVGLVKVAVVALAAYCTVAAGWAR